ncbi:zinc-binding dehydrogenase, partial [Streptomyces sp. NPDC052644]
TPHRGGGPPPPPPLTGLAPFGRLVTLGWRPGGHVDVPLRRLIEQSVGCAGFWMRHVVDDRELLCHIAQTLFEFARRGRLVAHVDRVVGLRDVAAAHAALAARATVGKVLIDVNRES